jgi:hypothetical protein
MIRVRNRNRDLVHPHLSVDPVEPVFFFLLLLFSFCCGELTPTAPGSPALKRTTQETDLSLPGPSDHVWRTLKYQSVRVDQ